jgi:ParB family transcriptional regulator, chromosome partitioning protein
MEPSMALSLDGLDLLAPGGVPESGVPLRLPISSIDEDPDQPRQEFDDDSLAELAATIRDRGVRQPVSVCEHPDQPGRWMLNFGARRLRASTLAGLSEIPAFVDNAADRYDQVIENEQRKGLTPLELALFVQRRLHVGDSQAEIARGIGKSRQYVTMTTALIDAPDWLMAAYRERRCCGLNELYELRKLARDHPQDVEVWTSESSAITRDRVMALRADLVDGSAALRPGRPAVLEPVAGRVASGEKPAVSALSSASAPTSESRSTAGPRQTLPPLRLLARLDDAEVVVDTQRAPPEPGRVFVRVVGSRHAEAVPATRLTLTGFVAE